MTISSFGEEDHSGTLIRFLVDSGATRHMCNLGHPFHTWRPYEAPQMVVTSTGDELCAMGEGEIIIYPMEPYDSPGLIVSKVLYVPALENNLLSISVMEEKGLAIKMGRGKVSIHDHEELLTQGTRTRGQYAIEASLTPNPRPIKAQVAELKTPALDLSCLTEEPQDWPDVLKLPQQEQLVWKEAMATELKTFQKHQVWTPANPSNGTSIISSRWTYSLKKDDKGMPVKARARLVARGFQQQYGADYDEVYAPVAKGTTIRILLSLASLRGLEVTHVDIDSAFLYGRIKEEIYIKPPPCLDTEFQKHPCYKLNVAIYGLKQAAAAWYERITASLSAINYYPSSSDQCLFISKNETGSSYLLIHVDDILIFGQNPHQVESVISSLEKEYKLKNLGPAKHYLGMHLTRKNLWGPYWIHQNDKILSLISKLNLDTKAPEKTPMLPDYIAQKLRDDTPRMENPLVYQQTLGSLLYMANTSRPDISLAVNVLGRCANSPSALDWNALIRVALYLKGTMDIRLQLGSSPKEGLKCYSDADWGGDPSTRRSTSGGCHFWSGGMVSWVASRQRCVSLSTAESEYVAAVEMCQETDPKVNGGTTGERTDTG